MNLGLSNIPITTIEVSDTNIYVCTCGNDLLFSNDNANSWSTLNTGLDQSSCITTIKKHKSKIIAVYDPYCVPYLNNKVIISTDNGNNWSIINSPIDSNIANLYINTIEFNDSIIFAGCNSGLYISKNNGISWVKKLLYGISSIILKGDSLYVSVGNSIYTSTNNGDTWTEINNGIPMYSNQSHNFKSLVLKGNTLILGSNIAGIFISSDNGYNWVQKNNGLSNINITSIAISGNKIFAGTIDGGIFLSSDDGNSWSEVNTGINNSIVNNITKIDTTLFLSNRNGYYFDSLGFQKFKGSLFLSTNNGDNWIVTDLKYEANKFAKTGNTIFAATTDGVYKSINNGLNWNLIGFANKNILDLIAKGDTIIISTWYNGIYISLNNGISWFQNNQFASVPSLALYNDTIYAGTYNNGVIMSTNFGNSWTQLITNISLYNDVQFISLVKSGNKIFAASPEDGIIISLDNGNNWHFSNNSAMEIVLANNLIFAATWNGVYYSSDFGINWTSLGLSNYIINSLTTDSIFLYVGSRGSGVWKRPLSDFVGIKEITNPVTNLKVFPNPFSNTTTFTYTLKENQKVNLSVYDITGRIVNQLVNENQMQGEHTLSFNAAGLQAGVYYYRLEAGDEVSTGKLILSK